ncbi:MAG: hypothetical protein MI784_14095 [Cytophagales bacterium]|nr:hypothetical protein [Cytophagales bacterium]
MDRSSFLRMVLHFASSKDALIRSLAQLLEELIEPVQKVTAEQHMELCINSCSASIRRMDMSPTRKDKILALYWGLSNRMRNV